MKRLCTFFKLAVGKVKQDNKTTHRPRIKIIKNYKAEKSLESQKRPSKNVHSARDFSY